MPPINRVILKPAAAAAMVASGRGWMRLAALFTVIAVSAAGMPARAADLSGVWWIKDRSGVLPLNHAKLPLLAAARTVYANNKAAVARGEPLPDPHNTCLPEGMPRLMLAPYPIQILQRPTQITFLHERMHMIRLIYIGRPHKADVDPSYNGDAIGRWEGETFVVDTASLNGQEVMDKTGVPQSDAVHIVERFHLEDGGQTLRDDVAVTDPKTFSAPVVFRLAYAKSPGVRLMEDVCTYGPPARDRFAGKTP